MDFNVLPAPHILKRTYGIKNILREMLVERKDLPTKYGQIRALDNLLSKAHYFKSIWRKSKGKIVCSECLHSEIIGPSLGYFTITQLEPVLNLEILQGG